MPGAKTVPKSNESLPGYSGAGYAAVDAGSGRTDLRLSPAGDLARLDVPDSSWPTIADTLAWLQAVRSAMDAERALGGASLEQADVVRSRLAAFESSLRTLAAPAQ